MKPAAALLLAAAALAACTRPRAQAGIHVADDGVRVVPSLSTSIAGLGVTVSQ